MELFGDIVREAGDVVWAEEGSWIYWMTDVENGAARLEEAHRGDSWISAGVTEVDVKDGVRWRQRICCGDP